MKEVTVLSEREDELKGIMIAKKFDEWSTDETFV